MPDLRRVYRRWLIRKLSILTPAVGVAVALSWRQAGRLQAGSTTLWIDLACLGASLLLAGFCGGLSVRALLCYRRFRSGDAGAARQSRRELEPAGPVAFVAFSLVVFVGVLPACFPPLGPLAEFPLPIRTVLEERRKSAAPAAAEERVPPPSRAEAKREPRGLPLSVPLAIEPGEARILEDQEEPRTPWTEERSSGFARLGVPDANRPFEWMAPELHVEVLLLQPTGTFATQEGDVDIDRDLGMRGAGLRFTYDLATDRDEGLRFHYQFFGLSASKDYVEISEASIDDLLVWQRFGATYLWRLLGYTSDAELDFSVFAGAMGDNLLSDGENDVAAELVRVSPYFGIEAGFWQRGPVGAVFRLGQTLPVNLTGGTALVTDLTALLRVDFTDGLSLHFGYAAYWAHFRDHAERFTDTDGHEKVAMMLHGPVVGIDLRF